MNCTASSYFIPHSISARATKTGALVQKNKISLAFVKAYSEKQFTQFSLLRIWCFFSGKGEKAEDISPFIETLYRLVLS